MAPPKRKAPSRAKSRRKQQPSLASRGAAAFGTLSLRSAEALGTVGLRGAGVLGSVVARNPSIAGGSMAFFVVFSFVAANALWYQPHAHPSPMFRTRDPASPYAIAGRKAFFTHDNADVTTFRIERPDDDAAKPDSVAAAIAAASSPNPPAQPASLLTQVQTALASHGFYQGAADGVMGPHTASAISAYQQSIGWKQTGEATPELLASLLSKTGPSIAVPSERPADVKSKAADVDPVAAAIMSAQAPDRSVKTAAVAPKKPAPAADPIAQVNMVMQIQKGLTNIAYSSVTIDGVADQKTRDAVLHFQKHYHLPENGVPDMTVLKKLKDIGAL